MRKWRNIKTFQEALEYLERNIPIETFKKQKGKVMTHSVHVLLHTARNSAVRRAVHEYFNVTAYYKEDLLCAVFHELNLNLSYEFDWTIWSSLYEKFNLEELKYSVEVVKKGLMYNGVHYELLTRVNYLNRDYYVLERTYKELNDEKQINNRMRTVIYKKNSIDFKLIN